MAWRPEEIKVERSNRFDDLIIFSIFIGTLCIYQMLFSENDWLNQGGE